MVWKIFACELLICIVVAMGQTCDVDSAAAKDVTQTTGLRFAVGDAVQIQMGRKQWQVATIASLHYQIQGGEKVPYLVQLEKGGMAYVPSDDQRLIKAAGKDEIARLRHAEKLTSQMAREAETQKAVQLAAAQDLQKAGLREDLQAVLLYHAESCHVRPGLYASGGSMDWENQPDKFRRVLGARSLDLPTSSAKADVASGTPLHELAALGVLLHDAAGITAWKQQGPNVKYSLRANPSSGALQPLELHVFGAIEGEAAHWHYSPYWHSLELVAQLPSRWLSLVEQLPKGSLLVGLTSIVWRNAWKYGDPGFRYTHHDVGHQISSLAFAAAAQNAQVVLLDSLTDLEVADLLRADEPEDPVCLLAIYPNDAALPTDEWWRSFHIDADFWNGAPTRNQGAAVQVYYGKTEQDARPLIANARLASRRLQAPSSSFFAEAPPSEMPPIWASAGSLRQLIHGRRSAQNYNPSRAPPSGLPRAVFFDILRRVIHQPAWLPWKAGVQPFLFVHRVADLAPGIYLLCRRSCAELREELPNFLWEPVAEADVPLMLLRRGDVREEARLGSCVQDIASDGAFAVAFLAEHLPRLKLHGASWYRRAHWEACALGGALYLAAEAAAAGLQGTGIGCFFAPWVQAVLKVDAPNWADVYHFTVGWPEKDRRVDVEAHPYHHVRAKRHLNRDQVSSQGH